MKFALTLRTVLIAAALLLGLAWLNDASPAVFGQATQPAAAGGPVVADTARVATSSPGKLSILSSLILGHIDFVTVTIFILSIVSLTFIIRGFIQAREDVVMPLSTVEQIRGMIVDRQLPQLLEFVEHDPSFVSRAIGPALRKMPHFNAMKESMETSIGEQTAEAFRKIEILNVIGNLGPLLGLLGTVLGMIEAFDAMQRAGTTDPGKLAGGIATALAHTFLGLFLAIPTLAAFGILRTTTDRLTTRAAIVSEEMLALIKQGAENRPAPMGQPPVATVLPPRPSTIGR